MISVSGAGAGGSVEVTGTSVEVLSFEVGGGFDLQEVLPLSKSVKSGCCTTVFLAKVLILTGSPGMRQKKAGIL